MKKRLKDNRLINFVNENDNRFIHFMNEKKAVGPVIATVLLVLIVVVLGVIILLWSQGFVKEAVTKNIGSETKTTEQFCSEINLQAILNNDKSFGFKNIGNVPIYAFSVKLVEKNTGQSQARKIDHSDGGSVNPGFNVLVEKPAGGYYNYDDYESVKILPILLGKGKKGGLQEYPCPEINALTI